MPLQLDAVSEEKPGPKWQRIFAQGWPAWREWHRRKMPGSEPGLAECERALGRRMPELLPVWRRMIELAGEEAGKRHTGGRDHARRHIHTPIKHSNP